MRHPGPVAAALIGTGDGDAVGVEPQRDRATPLRVDSIDDGYRAGWPPYRAPPDARSDDHQHLLWRPGHEDRVHHAVLDRAARCGRLADPGPQAQSGWIGFQLLAPHRRRWVAPYERTT